MLYTSGSFAVLESALLTAVRALQAEDRLARVWVIVPTNRVQQRVSRRLAYEGGGHVNVRALPLLDFAREIAQAALWARGFTPLPGLGAQEIARALLDDDETLWRRGARETPGFLGALVATIDDLMEAELAPERAAAHLQTWLRREHGADRRAAHIAAVVTAAARYRERLRALKMSDRGEVLRAAAEALEQGYELPVATVLLYGFYDLTPLQRRLVRAACRGRGTLLFMPWRPGAAFAYATPTRSWLQSLGERSEALPDGDGDTDLARVQSDLFEPRTPRAPRQADGSLEIISAPGEVREAREIARAVLRLVRDHGLAFDEIGILLRRGAPYTDLLPEMLGRAGIPYYLEGGTALLDTRAGQAMRLLLQMRTAGFTRSAVMEFLAVAPLPRSLPPGPPSVWDRLSAEARVVAGVEQWQTRLPRLRQRYVEREASLRAAGDEAAEWAARRTRQIDDLCRVVGSLIAAVAGLPEAAPWPEMCDAAIAAFRRHVEHESADEVVKAVDELRRLTEITPVVDSERFGAAVVEVLQGARTPCGRYGAGVYVGHVLEARGLTFRAVVIPGLVERVVPSPGAQDPLLLDVDRQRLNEALAAELPLKRDRADEERMLFALMVRAASERLVLTFPRLDMGSARARVPSWYLLEVMSAVSGEPATFAALAAWDRLRHVALSQYPPAVEDDAIDREERDLLCVEAAVSAGEAGPARHLFADAPLARQAARAHHRRTAGDALTIFEGALESDACRVLLRQRHSPAVLPVAATSLLDYARCPLRYFLRHVLKLRELDDPEAIDELTALDRGNLVHAILQDFHTEARARGWVPLGHGPLEGQRELLREIAARQTSHFSADGLTGAPLLWRRAQRRLDEDLQSVLAAERADVSDFRPAEFELGFGVPNSATPPVALALPDGRQASLWGRIDRVDISADRRGRVIDYKTGRGPKAKDGLPAAEALQLLVYVHAMRTLRPDVRWEAAELYFVQRGKGVRRLAPSRGLEAGDPTLAELVSAITSGVEEGMFPASGKPWCGFCVFPSICGVDPAQRYAAKRGDPRLARFEHIHADDPRQPTGGDAGEGESDG